MPEDTELRFRGKSSHEDSANKVIETQSENGKKKAYEADLRKTFWLTRIVFLRSLAFIYFVAFLISFDQNKELIGDNGLTPTKLYLTRIRTRLRGSSNWQLFLQYPTFFWFLPSLDRLDQALDLTAISGMFISAFVFICGAANSFLMAALWTLYHIKHNVTLFINKPCRFLL